MISYIIPAFNSAKTIEECIHSILIQKGRKEIIVVDNGSVDNTVKIVNNLGEKHPEINVLEKESGDLQQLEIEALRLPLDVILPLWTAMSYFQRDGQKKLWKYWKAGRILQAWDDQPRILPEE